MIPKEHVGIAAKQLGYTGSSGFFDAGRFDALPHNELRYGCRKAKETSGLQGVYLIRDSEGRNNIPILFVCRAETEKEARDFHRNVWNLNLVPYVVIETPTRIRVYQGFCYDAENKQDLAFVDAAINDIAEILDRLEAFCAESIDAGRI